jgi:hypothetical protein
MSLEALSTGASVRAVAASSTPTPSFLLPVADHLAKTPGWSGVYETAEEHNVLVWSLKSSHNVKEVPNPTGDEVFTCVPVEGHKEVEVLKFAGCTLKFQASVPLRFKTADRPFVFEFAVELASKALEDFVAAQDESDKRMVESLNSTVNTSYLSLLQRPVIPGKFRPMTKFSIEGWADAWDGETKKFKDVRVLPDGNGTNKRWATKFFLPKKGGAVGEWTSIVEDETDKAKGRLVGPNDMKGSVKIDVLCRFPKISTYKNVKTGITNANKSWKAECVYITPKEKTAKRERDATDSEDSVAVSKMPRDIDWSKLA